MLSRTLYILFLTFLFVGGAFSQANLKQYFTDCGFEGSITIFDYKNQKWIMSDSVESSVQKVPASTFKIANLLIALETGVIADELDIVKWRGKIDTAVYGYRPSTYKNMTVKEAFEVSAGWVFMELSKKIGRKRYQRYLKACGYGNRQVSDAADFWNFGPLAISSRNQIEFLVKVYSGKAPFSARSIDILKRVMVVEQNDDYILRAKTGWGWQNGIDVGWWVGYVEKDDNVYFFATRLAKDRADKNPQFPKCRIDITKRVLKDIGAL
ncbi:beta-lactamase class D [Sphingobacterium allocomposti]|uniref:beta-lactamase n=1 Tax=Sphingobacterium allocomposti TaxID=415956 RepID=A0A5S5DMK3_9SPHI|nr:class D beta-lactamase [Sphingobacterium composti Yoo et al. 2007 non Ten et al. 2007]TYP97091.1 beta-lactamase class D [Sphingobacterium composti Yoo et al. 2007 non Ten et al. 2007]